MADSSNAETKANPKPGASPSAATAPKKPIGNPVFRMMGLPNFRFRLPSRNWMIFWTVIGSWTGAWYYDRQQKKKIQHKWATLVKHMADDPIAPNALPRTLTIYLTSPPVDSVMTAREHFHEYIKPVLVASGVDWEVVEGRREGDVRAQLAERIRRIRKTRGEPTEKALALDDQQLILENERARMGVKKSPEVEGDIVIGRNTWKEYVRGLHEGWLGPLDEPKSQEQVVQDGGAGNGDGLDRENPPRDPSHETRSMSAFTVVGTEGAGSEHESSSPASSEDQPESGMSPDRQAPPVPVENQASEEKKEEKEKEAKPTKPKQPPPFIPASDYPSAALSPHTPPELTPSTTIPLPHLLGIRKTPIRMYRFLTRRHLADDIGRQVAAAVLASSLRPYHQSEDASSASSSSPFDAEEQAATAQATTTAWEQQQLLESEESEWHKSLKKGRKAEDESVWLDPMVVDSRIGARMRRFELDPEDDARANRMHEGKEQEDAK